MASADRPASEREAWNDVRRYVEALRRGVVVARVADQLDTLAVSMLKQLDRGLHANPPLIVYGNPLTKQRGRHPSGIISRRVYAIEYKHADDGEDYRHDFTPGVTMYAFGGDGSLGLQRPDGKPVSRELEV